MLYQFLLNFVDTFGFLNVFKYLTFRTGLSVFTSLIIVLIIGGPFIKFFSNQKIFNPIRDDGPEDHIVKKIGTPTMGGVIIMLGLLISVLFWADLSNINIFKLNKNIFLNFKIPNGRGDISKVKINKKNIHLIDESYNSNPLSLKSAILNFDKIPKKNSKKYLLLGDMLELGIHTKKLHQSIAPIINKTKVDKVFVKGKKAIIIFKNLMKSKRGRILNSNTQILELIKNDLNTNDYLMIKASNATGFNKIVNDLKGQG